MHGILVRSIALLVPIVSLLMAIYVLRPGWRWRLRRWIAWGLPAAFFALIGVRRTGDAWLARWSPNEIPSVVAQHATYADLLSLVFMPLVLIGWFALWVLPSASPRDDGRGEYDGHPVNGKRVLCGLALVLSVASVALSIVTAIAGAASSSA